MALETLVVTVALSLVLTLVVRRELHGGGWAAWVDLDAHGWQGVAAARASLRGRVQLVQVVLAGVEGEYQAGNNAEARELWHISVEALEAFVRDVSGRLASWAKSARVLLALHPLGPLGLRDVGLGRLRLLVMGWRLVHMVAVTSGERFRLRVSMLQRALGMVLDFWRRTPVPTTRGRWSAPAQVSHDVEVLAEAAGDTYEALAISRLTDEARRRLPAPSVPCGHGGRGETRHSSSWDVR